MATIGQNTDVDASAEVLVGSSIPVTHGTYIRAMAGNSDKVYVGLSSDVTAANGWQLNASEVVFISRAEAADANSIYVIGGAANQAVCYRAV